MLTAAEKTVYYQRWTADPAIGGVLNRYMETARVRVYIKDAMLKPYARLRLADWARCSRVLGVSADAEVAESFIKPHGRRLADGRVICWGNAAAWKIVLTAVFERSYGRSGVRAYAAVLLRATGRYRDDGVRAMVADAATRLGVERLVWLDT
ncbi:MAG: hypothetical protein HY907_05955 [Deltaproteobacteria bacterium]|nr:hypothetical protein [Deltaproteobacteria bacterium]